MPNDENKPIHSIKLRSISAAVFENDTQNGGKFPVAQITRSFRDGDQWKQSNSYSFDDLLVLQEVLELTTDWMRNRLIAQYDSNEKHEPS